MTNPNPTPEMKCPTCGSGYIVKFGKTSIGTQRYLCRELTCKTNTFQLNYAYIGCEKNPARAALPRLYGRIIPQQKIYNAIPLEA